MNGREKVIAALEYRNTGRAPVTISSMNSVSFHGKEFLEMLCSYPCDFDDLSARNYPTSQDLEKVRCKTDKWGCVWKTENIYVAGAVQNQPLKNISEAKSFKLPEVQKTTQKDSDNAERMREKFPVWLGIDQFFQVMQNIRGTEGLMMDLCLEPEKVQSFIDRMLNEYYLPSIEERLKVHPDIIGLGDDWGTQKQLLISPDMWRQFFKPVYRKMIDLCHKGGARASFHTCGYTIDILEDFIEIGLDIINPQAAIMDLEEYGRISHNRITVMPDLDRQNILVNGSPEQVKEHIRYVYKHLGSEKGGLIAFAPIECSMPIENVKAMLDVVCNYHPHKEEGK